MNNEKPAGGLSTEDELFGTTSHIDVLNMLLWNGQGEIVQKYFKYLDDRSKHLEEGESPGIILQSLQSWAWFLLDYAFPTEMPDIHVDADWDGCAYFEWSLIGEEVDGDPDNEYWGSENRTWAPGIMTMTFYPNRLVGLGLLSGSYGSNKRRLTLESTLSYDKAIGVLEMFRYRITDDFIEEEHE